MKVPSKILLPYLILALVMASCVSSRQFNELQDKYDNCNEERDRLKKQVEQLSVDKKELTYKTEKQAVSIDDLIQDTIRLSDEIAELSREYDQLGREFHDLKLAQEELVRGNTRETKRLLNQLQQTQEDLRVREEALKDLENELNIKKANLDELQFELRERNARLLELETILARKDSAVNALRNKVAAALIGFENEGLSVDIKNGKVYVSLEEKLLFPSGSTRIDARGINALKKLARVLEENKDINITIEGHTDDVPVIASAAMKDNWDLSVKRATAVVRILLDNSSIDPKRLTASGRGEYMPLDTGKTSEARQKNRRTEIILTPKLDELFQILESN